MRLVRTDDGDDHCRSLAGQSLPVAIAVLAPAEHADARAEHHQHLPDEERQEHQPVADLDVPIESQGVEKGEDQQRGSDDEAPKHSERGIAFAFELR